jgi:phospholipase/carboxylesterase
MTTTQQSKSDSQVEVITGTHPTHSIIWLHGLGADGHDFESIIFPHAPVQAITINGGMEMRAWYDLVSMDFSNREDKVGLQQSLERLEQLIAEENDRGIDSAHIFLAGFSQGGAVALHTGLRHANKLAGILALSTYLPLPDTLEAQRHPNNLNTDIFMAHGTFDQVIPVDFAMQSAQLLKDKGHSLDWQTFKMQHSVSMEEIVLISMFIKERL